MDGVPVFTFWYNVSDVLALGSLGSDDRWAAWDDSGSDE